MRAYRALLHLLPASFRREFGAEMEAIFATRRRAAHGILEVAWLWLAAAGDILVSAAASHWDILRQDLRFVFRAFARNPGFTVTAVLVTALGVGANAASFSVTDFVLLRPLPYDDAGRLVRLWETKPGYTQLEAAPATYRDWREGTRSFESMGAYLSMAVNLTGQDTPERLDVSVVEKSVLETLRVQPMIGRRFSADDVAGAPHTVILSYALWQSRFGGDPGILDRTITLDDRAFRVVGVMPPDFQFPSSRTRLWIGIAFHEGGFENRNDHSYLVVARLAPDATRPQAQAELDVVASRIAQSHPETSTDSGVAIGDLRDGITAGSRTLLWALSGASLCILLIACANLGNLLLARGLSRQRELAVRAALGAGRERVVRQLVTEGMVIAVLGGACGVLTAVAAMPLLARLIPDGLAYGGAPAVNLRVLAFAAVATVLTSILFAIIPVIRRRGTLDADELRGAGRDDRAKVRLRTVLVTVEIAASVVLLIGAGLLMRAIAKVQDVDPGFQSAGVFTLRTALSAPRFATVASRERFYRDILNAVEDIPGVEGAAYVSCLPMVCGGMIWPVSVNDLTGTFSEANTVSLRYLTPGYFRTMGIALLDGRDVTRDDRQDTRYVAVVSQSFANRYWPGENPIGRRFHIAFAEREVVGVVADTKVRGLERQSEPQVFLAAAQIPDGMLPYYWPKDLAVRSGQSPEVLLPALTRIIRAAYPDQPISDPQTMAEVLAGQTVSRAAQLQVLGVLAAVALLLAAVGIHGLLSFMVAQRSREIGVRMALGAGSTRVIHLVLKQGAAMALTGIALGAAVAYFAGRALQAALFGVPASDPLTFAIVIVLCLIMTLAGCLAPVRRAVRVDPLTAIRTE